jgi:hypothetical protein
VTELGLKRHNSTFVADNVLKIEFVSKVMEDHFSAAAAGFDRDPAE